jgi:hypothetical protein
MIPVMDPPGTIIEIITPAAVVVTEAPVGVVVAGWLFKTDVWSKGEERSTFENSQITPPPVDPDGFGVMVNVVAPALLL